MATGTIKDQPMNLVLFYPLPNLKISQKIGGEIQIERVRFISKDRIPYIRKDLGFRKTISELQIFWKKNIPGMANLFQEAPTYAVIKFRSKSKKELSEPLNLIKEAYWILVSSQFHRVGRNSVVYFGMQEHRTKGITELLLYEKGQKNIGRSFSRIEHFRAYELDKLWKKYLTRHFFFPLLKILNNEISIKIKRNWKETLRNAAILSGKSHFSKELFQAFLYNFIAIDSILLNRKEHYSKLSERLNGLFGWITNEEKKAWVPKVERLCYLRHKMVHAGKFKEITTADLLYSDNILSNLLRITCKFIDIFPNREALLELCRRVEAKRILNQKVTERPRFLFSLFPTNSEINRVQKANNWP